MLKLFWSRCDMLFAACSWYGSKFTADSFKSNMDAVLYAVRLLQSHCFDSDVKASVWASAGFLQSPSSVFSVNKCPSYAVLCRTRLLAVLNVMGLDSGPTLLTALLVQQLYGSLIPTLERAAAHARVDPGLMCSQITLPSSLRTDWNITRLTCCVCYRCLGHL